ncbi:MAG: hypothetical protein KatS3mg105_2633 [Gemmatales bacterium]|nr:MAG: hypothetical protein KatS3mg105_2633 [Gemmatales bacterium]
MQPRVDRFADAFVAAVCRELDNARGTIQHCVEQLTDEQLWARPAESMNSIGNLLLHLCGNLRQWIVSGIGGAADTRDRPREFAERGPLPRADLLFQLDRTVAEARNALRKATAESLLQPRRIQGFDVNGLEAVIDSVAHFRGHTQEIVHLTRRLLGERYRFAFVPATVEQGAPKEASQPE